MDSELLAGIDFRRIDRARVAYIHLYYERKRKQDRLASEASDRWEARKAVLTQRALSTTAPGWELDGTKFRETCDKDYALNDAMAAWSWHERESKRCESAIRTELVMEALRQAALRRPAPAPRSAGGVPSRG